MIWMMPVRVLSCSWRATGPPLALSPSHPHPSLITTSTSLSTLTLCPLSPSHPHPSLITTSTSLSTLTLCALSPSHPHPSLITTSTSLSTLTLLSLSLLFESQSQIMVLLQPLCVFMNMIYSANISSLYL